MRQRIIARLAPHIQRPGGGGWGWLAVRLMNRRNRRMNAWAVDLLDVQPSDHVLEIGFGAGVSVARVAQLATAGFVVGIDHAEKAVERATQRSRAAIRAGRVELRQGDVMALPYDDGAFDKAFCVGLIYYLPEPVAALDNIRRVLKPGGRFVIMARQPAALAQNPVFRQDDHKMYSGEELVALLTAAGYSRAWIEADPPDETIIGVIGIK